MSTTFTMADPKYANLPGIVSGFSFKVAGTSFDKFVKIQYVYIDGLINYIFQAHDQPDVFETNDLPESDQHCDAAGDANPDANSDAIETLHLSGNEAFGKFKGKQVRTLNVLNL